MTGECAGCGDEVYGATFRAVLAVLDQHQKRCSAFRKLKASQR